jgi:hypothetical protein
MMQNLIPTASAVLAVTPDRWTALTASLPGDLLNQPAAPGEWSALQCLQHLIDVERSVFPLRVRAFLAGQNFPAFNPDAEGTTAGVHSPTEMAAEFADLRTETMALLSNLTPADLERRAVHGELGPVTLGEMLHEWAAHDLMHTVQAERALMQPFIQACGPWQEYFKDHIA